ncbi:hypothetical protein D9M71_624320 [compost metagenome]
MATTLFPGEHQVPAQAIQASPQRPGGLVEDFHLHIRQVGLDQCDLAQGEWSDPQHCLALRRQHTQQSLDELTWHAEWDDFQRSHDLPAADRRQRLQRRQGYCVIQAIESVYRRDIELQ